MNLSKEQREAIEWAAEQASRTCLLDYRKSLRSLLTAPSADDAPTGWRLVPVEPTQTMIDALADFDEKLSWMHHPDVPYAGTVHGDSEAAWGRRVHVKRWARLIDAAPTPEDAPSTAQGVTNGPWVFMNEVANEIFLSNGPMIARLPLGEKWEKVCNDIVDQHNAALLAAAKPASVDAQPASGVDDARLQFLIDNDARVAFGRDRETCRVGRHESDDGDLVWSWLGPRCDDPRQAIDAAIAQRAKENKDA